LRGTVDAGHGAADVMTITGLLVLADGLKGHRAIECSLNRIRRGERCKTEYGVEA